MPKARLNFAMATLPFLAGCATAPPENYAVNNSRYYPSPKEAIFERILAVSARNNMLVTASDRPSGVLSVERPLVPPDRSGAVYDWADCGALSLAERPLSQLVELSLVVETAGPGARVTVNPRFTEMRQDLTHKTYRVTCTTTGQLERQLLEALARG